MNEKRVYTFGNGQAEGNAKMREVLGGKGANLAEMNLIGVPVPPGFTITTDTCNEYYEVGENQGTPPGRGNGCCSSYRGIDEQQVRFRRESSPRFSTFRCSRIYARYDGYHPQPWFE